jgi:hypothetical protein
MTYYIKPRRIKYFTDRDGKMSQVKRYDEIVPLIINWSDELGSDTISSVAYSDSGVTRSSTSNTTTTTTTYVTGTGETEITLTLASGAKKQRVVRYYDQESHDTTSVSDYD